MAPSWPLKWRARGSAEGQADLHSTADADLDVLMQNQYKALITETDFFLKKPQIYLFSFHLLSSILHKLGPRQLIGEFKMRPDENTVNRKILE